jgi:hypothetical protein
MMSCRDARSVQERFLNHKGTHRKTQGYFLYFPFLACRLVENCLQPINQRRLVLSAKAHKETP